MAISQKLIETFIFCKNEVVAHTLFFEIKVVVNLCQKIVGPLYTLNKNSNCYWVEKLKVTYTTYITEGT